MSSEYHRIMCILIHILFIADSGIIYSLSCLIGLANNNDDNDDEDSDLKSSIQHVGDGNDQVKCFAYSLIHGVGEFDLQDKEGRGSKVVISSDSGLDVPDVESLPYLLLDVRDKDAYEQCHIIGCEYFTVGDSKYETLKY